MGKRIALFVSVALLGVTALVFAQASSSSAASGGSSAPERATQFCGAVPCAWVYVEVQGPGRVQSHLTGGPAEGAINCPSTCDSFFSSWFDYTLELVAIPSGGVVRGWLGCPPGGQSGPTCVVEMAEDNTSFCLRAVFDENAPVVGTACPGSGTPPPPPIPSPLPPPNARCTRQGGAGPDVLVGTAMDDVLCGGGGNDVIRGGDGHDLIKGGAGNDVLRGGTGHDKLLGGSGNDRLAGESGRDRLYGEAGSDRLTGGAQFDLYSGGSGADNLVARDSVREMLKGGLGRDRARRDRIDRLRSIERLY